jgi:hypothetical protein
MVSGKIATLRRFQHSILTGIPFDCDAPTAVVTHEFNGPPARLSCAGPLRQLHNTRRAIGSLPSTAAWESELLLYTGCAPTPADNTVRIMGFAPIFVLASIIPVVLGN